ncbi:MAG: CDP-glycerol glycerophosphotransferase family protein, partial [Clostridiales bacterium]|nr:CDP-glycerol glycerophosphotransferase family protein [Clostridiales bacterium]
YEALAQMHKETPEERKAARTLQKKLAARSKAEMSRFFAKDARHELVFYSEGSGFYKYFKGYIEYILKHSDIDIHYVTSDPDDRIFEIGEPRIKAYYANDKDLVGLFMKMDADIFFMTTPDIGKYHLKRSLVRKDVEYIFADHGMTSLHLMLREGALDHFDTVFLYGPNHISEIRQTEFAYDLPQKTLVKTGYALLDELTERVAALEQKERARKKVLIAPSWQKSNLLDLCLDELIEGLSGRDYDIVIRPHPEFIKRFPHKVKRMEERLGGRLGKDIELETDFSSSESIYTADIVVTDWSTVAQEYSYTTKRPSLFVNTPMKTVNPNYQNIKAVPLDISLRDEIGVSVDVEDLGGIGEVCEKLIEGKDAWREKIAKVVERYIYNVGDGARNGGEYIIDRINYKRGGRPS